MTKTTTKRAKRYTKAILINVSTGMYDALKKLAYENERSVSGQVRFMIREATAKQPSRTPK